MLVAPSGSNIIYSIFMNGNYTTGVCLIQSLHVDYANNMGALICEIWMIGFVNTFSHWDTSHEHNCTISYGITCIRRMLHALEYGSWGYNYQKDMAEVFDFPGIFKLVKQDPNTKLLIFYKKGYRFKEYLM